MRFYLAAMVSLLLALPAAAEDYYVRGTFGTPTGSPASPWNDLSFQMTQDSLDPTHYTKPIGDSNTYFAGVPFDFKIATADFTTAVYPDNTNGNNVRIVTDNNGEMNFHLWTNGGNPWTDGYSPKNTARVGYNDPGQFGWEVIGSF